MFSDRFRWIAFALTCTVILVICVLGKIQGEARDITFEKIATHPQRYEGVTIFPNVRRIQTAGTDSVTFVEGHERVVTVFADSGITFKDFTSNDIVSFAVRIEDGRGYATRYYIHTNRLAKVVVSLITLAICVVLAFKFIVPFFGFKKKDR